MSSQSKIIAQQGFAIGLVDAECMEECNRRGDPGSESELTSESALVLHSEAGRLVDLLPSFQLSGDRVHEGRENESFGLGGVEDVTGGRSVGDELLPV